MICCSASTQMQIGFLFFIFIFKFFSFESMQFSCLLLSEEIFLWIITGKYSFQMCTIIWDLFLFLFFGDSHFRDKHELRGMIKISKHINIDRLIWAVFLTQGHVRRRYTQKLCILSTHFLMNLSFINSFKRFNSVSICSYRSWKCIASIICYSCLKKWEIIAWHI